jgi:hypothetical protein
MGDICTTAEQRSTFVGYGISDMIVSRKAFVLNALTLCLLFCLRSLIMSYDVGDWVEFDYTDQAGVSKHWTGEIKEVNQWGYRLFTQDGYRSFRFYRMKNMKACVC